MGEDTARGEDGARAGRPEGGSGRWSFAHVTACLLALGGAAGAAGFPSPVVEPPVEVRAGLGPARVLVELRLPGGFTPEGELPGPAAVSRQRETIERLQQSVVSRLAGTRFTVVRRFESVPLIALEIHADALAALRRMGDAVLRVSEDALAAPAGAPEAAPGKPAR